MHKALIKFNRVLVRAQAIEHHAHEMASLPGHMLAEGLFDVLEEDKITIGGEDPASIANRILRHFQEDVANWEDGE